MESTEYYVVKKKAVPEVLLSVVKAKRLLESGRVMTIQEAVDQVGISRSSFYKYKDDIFPFHDNTQGRTVTFIFEMDDEPGLLSDLLKIVAEYVCDQNIYEKIKELEIDYSQGYLFSIPSEHL